MSSNRFGKLHLRSAPRPPTIFELARNGAFDCILSMTSKTVAKLVTLSATSLGLSVPQQINASPSRPRRRASQVVEQSCQPQSRAYATIQNSSKRHKSVQEWPKPFGSNRRPTPYQIFSIDQKGVYTKKDYYELVKIYHPDRCGHEENGIIIAHDLPRKLKVERFRLIVTAHEILSDPAKRRAYDMYGAGWEGHPAESNLKGNPFDPKRWENDPRGSPAQNATWEDWERWYQGNGPNAKNRRDAQLFSNITFFSGVALMTAIGGLGQFARAEKHSELWLEQQDKQHNNAAEQLARLRSMHADTPEREQQIDAFLRRRERNLSDMAPMDSPYEKFYAEREVCTVKDMTQEGE
jgi:hypothetical protein